MARYDRSYTGEHRTEFVGFYVTPSERALLDTAARKRGASINVLAREIALERAADQPVRRAHFSPEVAATKRQLEHSQHALNAAGNLLNQIARHANMTGELSQEHLDVLKDALDLTKRAIELYITGLQLLHSLGR